MPTPAAGGPGTPGSNSAVIDLAASGVRVSDTVVEFAVATHDRRTAHTYPAEFDIYVDTNDDGIPDFVIWNQELGGFASTGQTVVYYQRLGASTANAAYYAGVGFDSSTMILTVPRSALGIADGQTFSYDVYAFDNYFTGVLTDAIVGQLFTVGEQLLEVEEFVEVPANGRTQLSVSATGDQGETTQTGLLLLHQSAATTDFEVVTVRR